MGLLFLFIFQAVYIYIAIILIILPAWLIYKKAGLKGWLSLTAFIPILGPTIVLIILAFARWPATDDIAV